jgi:hypothetical protein
MDVTTPMFDIMTLRSKASKARASHNRYRDTVQPGSTK